MNSLNQTCRSTRGSIQIILGPMFSGKSTELIRRIKRFQIANCKCIVFKYAKDTRYTTENLSTHDTVELKDIVVPALSLNPLREKVQGVTVIGIDEGQFFPDIIEFAESMANIGKIVIVAALDGTFQRKGFTSILNLIPLSENVIKLNAVCMNCFNEGAFTKRRNESTELEVIGGADTYMAVCRNCFLSESQREFRRPILKSMDLNGRTNNSLTSNTNHNLTTSSIVHHHQHL